MKRGEFITEMGYRHRQNGVRCGFCDRNWPCDVRKAVEVINELIVDVKTQRARACQIVQRNLPDDSQWPTVSAIMKEINSGKVPDGI